MNAFIFVLWGDEFGRVMLVGTLLTLGMGVAETCKRAVWLRQGHPIFGAVVARDDGKREDADFYLTGANWSSAVFPSLLCVVPLLIPKVAVFPTFFVLSAQYIHRHFFEQRMPNVWLIVVNVILGFTTLRLRVNTNLYDASGMTLGEKTRKQFVFPHDSKLSLTELNDAYLDGTPFNTLLKTPVPLKFTHDDRFNHMHIVGGTGAGKTTLLENLSYR